MRYMSAAMKRENLDKLMQIPRDPGKSVAPQFMRSDKPLEVTGVWLDECAEMPVKKSRRFAETKTFNRTYTGKPVK